MTPLMFRKLLHERLEKTVEILDKKAGEYARNNDRLSNFKRAAAMMQCTPARACVGAWSKHLTSIMDMVDDLENGVSWPMAVWEEKLGDAVNYLILLEALIKEGVVTQEKMAGGGCADEPVKAGGMEGL